MARKIVTLDTLSYFFSKLLVLFDNKVDKESGKTLSDENYTSTDKENVALIPDLSTAVTTTATAVKEINSDVEALEERIAGLEYKPIAINKFNISVAKAEIGSSQAVSLTWELNKTPASQKINNVNVSGNSINYTVTGDTTYTLVVADDKNNTHSASQSIKFYNNIYYGAAINDTALTGLTRILSDNKANTFDVESGSNQYIYYAVPKRLGTVKFFVGGFEGGFDEPYEKTLKNSSGYSEVYYVYRSTRTNLGSTTITTV